MPELMRFPGQLNIESLDFAGLKYLTPCLGFLGGAAAGFILADKGITLRNILLCIIAAGYAGFTIPDADGLVMGAGIITGTVSKTIGSADKPVFK